tara:strand:- start:1221 stop:2021 length:801 start_codon:yes stop_codon:yes gene_type:complete
MLTIDEVKISADGGDSAAQYQLGCMFLKGSPSFPRNVTEGVHWLRLASDQDLDKAQYYLGWLYCEGDQEYRDIESGERLLKCAAEKGYRDAQQYLATRRYNSKNYSQAIDLFKMAAQQDDELALYQLGYIYYEGKVVPKDLKKAFDYFNQSAELGEKQAQLSLCLMLGKGEGVESNFEKSVYWLKKSADQGVSEAEYMLGLMYLNGKHDVKIDASAALDWLSKAAKQGHQGAQLLIKRVDNSSTSFSWLLSLVIVVVFISVLVSVF